MATSRQLVPVTSWLTLPRWVYRHRIHSGYFLDHLKGVPGYHAERERELAQGFAGSGIPWEPRRRPAYLFGVERRWKEFFGESSPEDAFRATGEDPQEEDTEAGRLAATERLAVGLSRRWRTSPAVKAAIHERAEGMGEDWTAAKCRAAAVGVSLALARMDDPQRIRFGNHYLVSPPSPHPVDVRPVTQLAAVPLIRWLHRQSVSEAEALVLGEPPRDAVSTTEPETVPLDDCSVFLEDVVASEVEEMVFTSMELDSILAAADLTPADREAVDAFLQTGDWPDAARLLGWSEARMRQRKRRLLEKLAPG